MTDPLLYFLKFGLLGGLYFFLFWLLRFLVRDLGGRSVPSGPSSQLWLEVVDGHASVENPAPVALSDTVTIGRAPGCQVQVHDPFCSARHARLVPRDGGVVLEDLDSTNGVTIDGQTVESGSRLKVGQRFSIGEVTFEIKKKP
ncbi:MAG: FHA domain-containing protein [Vulcanimicrobiota bacterium]